ncbi:MAG: alkaline phosphatase [Bacteroidales bacterium]|jgi:alkaline phosphatase|nr:alkaline phosphatase [Bacteroidales bacterium]
MKRYYTLLTAALLIFSVLSDSNKLQAKGKAPKYIFYFIGDGMGISQVTATETYLALKNDKIGISPLSFTNFPVRTTVTTFADNRVITGSAAAGTALASGHKTSINTIGMNANHTAPLISVAQNAKDNKKRVGIITSVSIDHATPAAFYAHQQSRRMYYAIGRDLTKSNLDFFAGGDFVYPKGKTETDTSLYYFAEKNNFSITRNAKELKAISNSSGKVLALSNHIQNEGSLYYAIDRDSTHLDIADYTEKAIEVLDNKKGFFIMVEGGKIDWACHSNDFGTMLQEIIDFDDAVKKAIEFYNKHPKETLIIVTADHETGGMSLGNSNLHYETRINFADKQKMSLDEFEIEVNKLKEEEATFETLISSIETNFGINSVKELRLNTKDINLLKRAYFAFFKEDSTAIARFRSDVLYGSNNPVVTSVGKIFSTKIGIGWGTGSHTGVRVPLYVIGRGSKEFINVKDNIDIPNILRRVSKW